MDVQKSRKSNLNTLFLAVVAATGAAAAVAYLPTAPDVSNYVDPYKSSNFTVADFESKADACIRQRVRFISNSGFDAGVKGTIYFEGDALQNMKEQCQIRYGALKAFNPLTSVTVTPSFDDKGQVHGSSTNYDYAYLQQQNMPTLNGPQG